MTATGLITPICVPSHLQKLQADEAVVVALIIVGIGGVVQRILDEVVEMLLDGRANDWGVGHELVDKFLLVICGDPGVFLDPINLHAKKER